MTSLAQQRKLTLKEHAGGFYVKGLSSFAVKSVAEMTDIVEKGCKNRHIGETKMNRYSSRSHSIFIIDIELKKILGALLEN